jgi:hypothetical protein
VGDAEANCAVYYVDIIIRQVMPILGLYGGRERGGLKTMWLYVVAVRGESE